MPRLQSEVDEVLGNKESVSAEDLENLQYTEQVCVQLEVHFGHPLHILGGVTSSNILVVPQIILIINYAKYITLLLNFRFSLKLSVCTHQYLALPGVLVQEELKLVAITSQRAHKSQ